MNIYKKVFSGCVVLMSSMMMIACDQSASEQSGDLNTNQSATTTTITSNKSGPSVALSSSDISVYEGDTFTLDIMMSDFTVSEGGGVTLRFDPVLLQVVNVNIDGTVWSFENKDGRINNADGTVSDILFSSYQGVEGDAKIATVEFKSIEKGMSTITLEESASNLFAGDGQQIAVVFNSTTVVSN